MSKARAWPLSGPSRASHSQGERLFPDRNGFTCQMCGAAAGDPDPYHLGRSIRLTMGHIIDKSKGGEDSPANLRAVCTNCNEGLQNAALPKPDRVWLLAQVRRATIDDQKAVLDWLLQKFGGGKK